MRILHQPTPFAHGLLSILLAVCAGARAAAQNEELSAKEFLHAVRQPFKQEAWGRFSGKVVHIGEAGKQRAAIRIAISFSADTTEALVVLDEGNTYRIRQEHGPNTTGRAEIERPEKERGIGLFDVGIQPDDMTLGFLYWNLIKELPRDKFRRQPCRILALEHPDLTGHARVWFSAAEGFPLKVEWYHAGDKEPWRQLEFKGAKRHRKDFWFVKEMRLEGENWKTQVTLAEAELYAIDEQPMPDDLLTPTPMPQPQTADPVPNSVEKADAEAPAKPPRRLFKTTNQ